MTTTNRPTRPIRPGGIGRLRRYAAATLGILARTVAPGVPRPVLDQP